MNCNDCKNYKPKEKLPVIKVEAWYWKTSPLGDGTWHDQYTFTDQPDWKRIIRETFSEGAEVVRVTRVKGKPKWHPKACSNHGQAPMLIFRKGIEPGGHSGWYVDYDYRGWDEWEDYKVSDTDIESAIREYRKADTRDCASCKFRRLPKNKGNCFICQTREDSRWQPLDAPKSTHKKGERYYGKPFDCDKHLVPAGHHFEYAGEVTGTDPSLFNTDTRAWLESNGEAMYGWYSSSTDWEILNLVPDAPQPNWPAAALESLEKKWWPIANGEDVCNAECAMCEEQLKFPYSTCPLSGAGKCDYCHSFVAWNRYKYAVDGSPEEHAAALDICDRLCEIAGVEKKHQKQRYTVGQYVWWSGVDAYGKKFSEPCIAKITALDKHSPNLAPYYVDAPKVTAWVDTVRIRPAVPSDFDVRVGNMTMRAYETKQTDDQPIIVRWSDETTNYFSTEVAAAYGYPVCPLSVSGGKFEAPKGEK